MSIVDVTFQMYVSTEFFEKVSFEKIETSTSNEDIIDSEIESSIRVIYPRLDIGRVNLKIPVHIKYINNFTNYKITIIECTCKLRSIFQFFMGLGIVVGLILSIISANIFVLVYPIIFAFIFFIGIKIGIEKQVIDAIRKFDK